MPDVVESLICKVDIVENQLDSTHSSPSRPNPPKRRIPRLILPKSAVGTSITATSGRGSILSGRSSTSSTSRSKQPANPFLAEQPVSESTSSPRSTTDASLTQRLRGLSSRCGPTMSKTLVLLSKGGNVEIPMNKSSKPSRLSM